MLNERIESAKNRNRYDIKTLSMLQLPGDKSEVTIT